jgi:hypothetical protein
MSMLVGVERLDDQRLIARTSTGIPRGFFRADPYDPGGTRDPSTLVNRGADTTAAYSGRWRVYPISDRAS